MMRYAAAKDGHDDIVMALAIGWFGVDKRKKYESQFFSLGSVTKSGGSGLGGVDWESGITSIGGSALREKWSK
jgi:hypothetical protein